MMHMTFYWGRKVTILFDSWKTDSWISYFISLVACFLFCVFYQYMEDRRLKLKLLTLNTKNPPSSSGGGVNSPLLYSKSGGGKWSASRFAGAILFGVNSAIGYFFMLAIMSFNGGVFIAVVLGLAVGYLIFRSGGDGEEVVVADNPCACA
ncbi:Copper transporter 5 [Forsythia ovata]|uniref:Copper transport protein n=1 Tax=Forsythia ovata TaxID=205694 RepID=A0ABD1WIE5_9LAMI